MKIETNQENGWIRYASELPGKHPLVRQHLSGEISLLSPSDHKDKVKLSTPDEQLSVLSVLKQIQSDGFGVPTQERIGDLTISYTTDIGLSIRRRKVEGRQFHFVTKSSLDFVIEALEYISAHPT